MSIEQRPETGPHGSEDGTAPLRRQLELLHAEWDRNRNGFDWFGGSIGSYEAMLSRGSDIAGQIYVLEHTLSVHDVLPDVPLPRLTGLAPETHRLIHTVLGRTLGAVSVMNLLSSDAGEDAIRSSLTELAATPQRF